MTTRVLRFHISQGDQSKRTLNLGHDIIKIGRLSSSHIQIHDPSVSRMHAVIEVSPEGEINLIDLGSAHGTFVNGERINKSTIHPEDQIVFGETTVTFEIAEVSNEELAAMRDETQIPTDGAPTMPPSPEMLQAYGLTESTEAYQAAAPPPQTSGGQFGSRPDYYPELVQHTGKIYDFKDIQSTNSLQISQIWHDDVLYVHQYPKAKDIFIGEHPKCDFHVPTELLPDKKFPLIKAEGDAFLLQWNDNIKGKIVLDKETILLSDIKSHKNTRVSNEYSEGTYLWPIPEKALCIIELEDIIFQINAIPRMQLVAPFVLSGWDYGALKHYVVSSVIHGIILAIIFSWPQSPVTFSADQLDTEDRFAKFLVTPPAPPPSENKGLSKEEKGKKVKDDKNKKENIPAVTKKQRIVLKGAAKELTPGQKLKRDMELVKSSGLVKALKTGGSVLNSIFDSGSALSGGAENAWGNLDGNTPGGDSYGYGQGYGLGGGGGGPGGTSGLGDTVAYNSIKTWGGGGRHSKARLLAAKVKFDKHKTHKPELEIGTAIIAGTLSRSIIRQVIQSHRNEIKYCYERELIRFPKLYGKIIVIFHIAPSGMILKTAIKSSTMRNKNVEGCVLGKIARWMFPKPEGGGMVVVTYPFIFKAAGKQ